MKISLFLLFGLCSLVGSLDGAPFAHAAFGGPGAIALDYYGTGSSAGQVLKIGPTELDRRGIRGDARKRIKKLLKKDFGTLQAQELMVVRGLVESTASGADARPGTKGLPSRDPVAPAGKLAPARAEDRYARARALLAGTDEISASFRDAVTLAWVKKVWYRCSLVAIVAGNRAVEPTPGEVEEMRKVVRGFVERSWRILYDADSNLAPVIREEAGTLGIGLSALPPADGPHVGHISIENPYLRLKAYETADQLVLTPDSVTGLGLRSHVGKYPSLYDNDKKMILTAASGDGTGEGSSWNDAHFSWSNQPKPDLGAKFLRANVKADAAAILKGREHSTRKDAISYDLSEALPASSDELTKLIQSAQSLVDGKARLAGLPGGAVIFGSGKTDPAYTDLVFGTARMLAERGLPVVTGGSGGFMEVANAGAHAAGGASIGIPLSDGLRTEKAVPEQVQTLTIRVPDYGVRIPLLLARRQLVIFAPGGAGTMKELATVLLQIAADPARAPKIIFLGEAYYAELYRGLLRLPIPDAVKAAISIAGSVEEVARQLPVEDRKGVSP